MRNIVKEPPTEKVKDLKTEGLSDEDILKALRPSYSNKDLNDAMNQSKQEIPEDNVLEELDQIPSKESVESSQEETPMDAPEPEEGILEEAPAPETSEVQPSFQSYPDSGMQAGISSDQTQELIEAVVDEKWEDLTSRVGDLNLWKESVNNDLEAVKQEVLRIQERINNLQNVTIGKVTEYSKNIGDIGTEMKALEKVFQRILQPLVTNIKELDKVTSELKSHKHHASRVVKTKTRKKHKKKR